MINRLSDKQPLTPPATLGRLVARKKVATPLGHDGPCAVTVVISPLHSLTGDMRQAARDSVAGFAQESAIRRASEGFVGPNARAGRGFGLDSYEQCCYNGHTPVHAEALTRRGSDRLSAKCRNWHRARSEMARNGQGVYPENKVNQYTSKTERTGNHQC